MCNKCEDMKELKRTNAAMAARIEKLEEELMDKAEAEALVRGFLEGTLETMGVEKREDCGCAACLSAQVFEGAIEKKEAGAKLRAAYDENFNQMLNSRNKGWLRVDNLTAKVDKLTRNIERKQNFIDKLKKDYDTVLNKHNVTKLVLQDIIDLT